MIPKEIIGHVTDLAQLSEDINAGNVVHAYLFRDQDISENSPSRSGFQENF